MLKLLFVLISFTYFSLSDVGSCAERIVLGKNESMTPLSVLSVTDNSLSEMEFDYHSMCGKVGGLYLSPFKAGSQLYIERLLADANVSGSLCVSVFLSYYNALGVSKEARLAYIGHSGLDPVDLRFDVGDKGASRWLKWRNERYIKFLRAAIQKKSVKSLFLMQDIKYFGHSEMTQLLSLHDPVHWKNSAGKVTVLLDGHWESASDARLVGPALSQMRAAGLEVGILLRASRMGKGLDLLGQVINLRGNEFSSVYVLTEGSDDVSRAKVFFSDILNEFSDGFIKSKQ